VATPNLFVIGAQRCGTTALCNHLGRHPQVFISTPKEPAFFTRDRTDTSVYEALFESAHGVKVIGEGSTRYSQAGIYPGVAPRLAHYCPTASIVYMVRDPIERICSAWVQYRSEAHANVSADFGEALRSSPELLDASRYEFQLAQYEMAFPAAQIKVILLEDLIAEPEKVWSEVLTFLEVEPTKYAEGVETNPSRGKLADRTGLRLLRSLGVDEALRRLGSPSGRLRTASRRVLKVGVTKPTLDDAQREDLRALVQEEARTFLDRLGRSTSVWPTTFGL
jgi:hypothetical protein